MGLRGYVAALLLWVLLLSWPSQGGEAPPPEPTCPDHERRQLLAPKGDRGTIPVVPCDPARPSRAPGGEAALLLGQPVDLNTATAEELRALPGIGVGFAKRILEDREARGPFKDLQDLARVPGFGAARVRALEGWASAGETPHQ